MNAERRSDGSIEGIQSIRGDRPVEEDQRSRYLSRITSHPSHARSALSLPGVPDLIKRVRSNLDGVIVEGTASSLEGPDEKAPRVLLCTDHLPPSDGGVEQVVEGLARRLSTRGYVVGVYALCGPDEQFALSDDSRVSVFTSRKIDLTRYVGLQSSVSPGAVVDFASVVSDFNPDIVHAHNRFFFTSYVALIYQYVFNYSLVTTLHLGTIDHLGGPAGTAANVLESVFPRRLVEQSDSVICVSDAVADVARSLGAERTIVAPNAVDVNRFDVGNEGFDKRILYVGRLVRNNGPHVLIKAVPRILEEHPDAQIDIVGSGDLKPELEHLTEEFGVADAVTIHGFVDDILEMYRRADIFCRPSTSEGLPLTLLESMATRTVPVVTPIAGAKEVLSDGETGRFVDVHDPGAIAATISNLLDHPEKIYQMAQIARTYVERQHSWEQRVDTITDEYARVITRE